MRFVSRALPAGGLGLAAAFLVACGASSGLLSTSENGSLNAELNAASAAIASNNCASAEKAVGSVETQVANLPGSVDPTLVTDLSNGAQAVRQLVKQQCTGAVGTSTHTSSSSTTTPTVTHTTTSSTSTSTSTTGTSTATTPQTTTSTTPATPSTPSPPATSTPTPGTTIGGSGGAPFTGGTGNTGN